MSREEGRDDLLRFDVRQYGKCGKMYWLPCFVREGLPKPPCMTYPALTSPYLIAEAFKYSHMAILCNL